MEEIKFISSGRRITIYKEFLDDKLGERDWNNEKIIQLPNNEDEIYRLRGKSKESENAWEYNVFIKE